LAETTIGLFKTEAIGRGNPFLSGPLRTIDDWYNTRGLHGELNYIPLRSPPGVPTRRPWPPAVFR
jgi:hypothetical protein